MDTPPEDAVERTEKISPSGIAFLLLVAFVTVVACGLGYVIYDKQLIARPNYKPSWT
jgi:hypothetical protein